MPILEKRCSYEGLDDRQGSKMPSSPGFSQSICFLFAFPPASRVSIFQTQYNHAQIYIKSLYFSVVRSIG